MYPSFTSTTFQLPSPHYITLDDDIIFNELLQQEETLSSNDHINHNANNILVHQELSSLDIRANLESTMGKCSNNNGDNRFNKPKTSTSKRRASKTDRHSKINTAQGLRDRRMRLSLEVSKKFFKLQDMLGFDKASQTVEWLLMKSNSNIQELMIHNKSSFSGVSISESSASRCEFSSECIDGDQVAKRSCNSDRNGKKKTRQVRSSSYRLRSCDKQTREMARKRARERTLEKSSKLAFVSGVDDQFSKFAHCLDLTMDQGMNCFGSWTINQPNVPLQNIGVSPTTGGWNPSFLFSYLHTGVHPQEHQFSDFQIHGN